MKHPIARILWTAAAALALSPAFAQMAPASPEVYKAFGEKPGLVRLVDDLMRRIEADSRIAGHFKDANKQRVKEQLVDQFCQVSGGPCEYKGADMKSSHAGLDINKAHFNALVEVLQDAMDAQGIPFGAQNRLLAQLAFMHRDVITVR
jgi:hemoglobin